MTENADLEVTREALWQMAWRTLADHQWGDWECSCKGVRKESREYEDNHLADVLSVKIADLMANAWDEGRAAERRDWEFTFDIVTPDEDRQPLPNPYRIPPEEDAR